MQKINYNLFLTGFIQVYLVAVNTCFLADKFYYGVLIAAFLISITWTFNVKKIAFGNITDRFVYSVAAALGSVAGLFTADIILKP